MMAGTMTSGASATSCADLMTWTPSSSCRATSTCKRQKVGSDFHKSQDKVWEVEFHGPCLFSKLCTFFSGPCPFLKQTIWSLLIGQLSFYGFLQMWNNMNRQESERLGSSMMASSNCPKRTRCAVCAPLLMKERGGVVKVGLPKKSICHFEKKSSPPPTTLWLRLLSDELSFIL